MITKREYVELLARLYRAANSSDSDSKDRPDWMKGHEAHAHCRAFDEVVRDLGLGEIWGNIIEGDCLDQVEGKPAPQEDPEECPLSEQEVLSALIAGKFRGMTDRELESFGGICYSGYIWETAGCCVVLEHTPGGLCIQIFKDEQSWSFDLPIEQVD